MRWVTAQLQKQIKKKRRDDDESVLLQKIRIKNGKFAELAKNSLVILRI